MFIYKLQVYNILYLIKPSTYLFFFLPQHPLINYPCLTTHYQFFSPHSYNLAGQLWDASSDGNKSTLLSLLHRGTDPDHLGLYPLHMACRNNHPHCAEPLIKWGAQLERGWGGDTPLHQACYYNNMACVKVLLAHHSPTGEPGCVCSCV